MSKNSGFNLRIKMNPASQIIKEHGLNKDGKVVEFLRNEIDRFSDPYVPFSTGSGAHMKILKQYPSNHEIKYIAPYAHYHYKGKKAIGPTRPKGVKRKISNEDMNYQGAPKRGPEWDKRMMRDRGKDICKNIEVFIKNGN